MDKLSQLEFDTQTLINDIRKKQPFFHTCLFILRGSVLKRVTEILKRWLFEVEVLKAQLEKKDLEIKELKPNKESFVPWKPENKGKKY